MKYKILSDIRFTRFCDKEGAKLQYVSIVIGGVSYLGVFEGPTHKRVLLSASTAVKALAAMDKVIVKVKTALGDVSK